MVAMQKTIYDFEVCKKCKRVFEAGNLLVVNIDGKNKRMCASCFIEGYI